MSQKFVLEVECGNAAFEDCAHELARIMNYTTQLIKAGLRNGECRDWNGNVVGLFRIYTTEEDNK
jgi:hypothetical protein